MLALIGLRIKYSSKIFTTIICTQSLLMGVKRTAVSFLAFPPPPQMNSWLGCLLISISFYPTEALVLCRTAVFKLWSVGAE